MQETGYWSIGHDLYYYVDEEGQTELLQYNGKWSDCAHDRQSLAEAATARGPQPDPFHDNPRHPNDPKETP